MKSALSRFIAATTCLLATTIAMAVPGETPQSAARIRFARGAQSETVAGRLSKAHDNRYYKVKTRRGQRMSIKVMGLTRNGIVPLLFLTSPSGARSTEKTARIDTYTTETGDYLIRVAPNLMASNGDSGRFALRVWIR